VKPTLQQRQRVAQRIAHVVDPRGADSLAGKIGRGFASRDEVPGRQPVDQDAVDLLGDRAVVLAQTRPKMSHGDLELHRGKRGRERRVAVTRHHDDVRPLGDQDALHALQRTGHLGALGIVFHVEDVVGGSNGQQLRQRLGQPRVLPPKDRHGRVPRGRQPAAQRRDHRRDAQQVARGPDGVDQRGRRPAHGRSMVDGIGSAPR
jgi:hypothetical protein